MTDLIARLEAATEGSRELDFDIAEHLGMHPRWSNSKTAAKKMHQHVGGGPIPAWTGSIDAALALVPEGRDYEITINGTADSETWTAASVRWWPQGRDDEPRKWQNRSGNGATTALALCIAALRARETET